MGYDKLILAVIISIISIGCGTHDTATTSTALDQTSIAVNGNNLDLDQSTGIVLYESVPFTGKSESYYANDALAESILFLNGKKHGLRQKWYPDGVLSYQAEYNHGRHHGVSQSWWKNGNLRNEANHMQGKLSGIQKEWYMSGAPFKELTYVYGLEEGMQRAWRENGKIYNNYEAKNGRIFGLKRSSLCYEIEEQEVQYATN